MKYCIWFKAQKLIKNIIFHLDNSDKNMDSVDFLRVGSGPGLSQHGPANLETQGWLHIKITKQNYENF